jgi:hypothetical protein
MKKRIDRKNYLIIEFTTEKDRKEFWYWFHKAKLDSPVSFIYYLKNNVPVYFMQNKKR